MFYGTLGKGLLSKFVNSLFDEVGALVECLLVFGGHGG